MKFAPTLALAVSGTFVIVAYSPLVACSSFGDAATGADDAGPPGLDAGGRNDGAIEPDAAAPTDGGDAGIGYCAQHTGATICSDFDSAPTFEPWASSIGNTGTLYRSTTVSLSPSWSMFSSVGPISEDDARLRSAVPPKTSHVRLGFDIKLGVVAPQPVDEPVMISLAEIYCGDGEINDGLWIFYDLSSGALHAIAAQSQLDAPITGSISDGEWTRIEIDGHFDESVATVTVGGSKIDVPLQAPCSSYPIFDARVGLATSTGGTTNAYYDNVLLEEE